MGYYKPQKKIKNVSDSQWVEKFNKLSDIIGRHANYETSEGNNINLMGWKNYVYNNIEGLPEQERQWVIHRFNRFSLLKSKLGQFKKKMNIENGKNLEVPLEVMKTEILEMYGLSYTTEEIHKKLIEDSGLNISFSSLKRFYLRYKTEIESIRIEYENQIGAIGISRKRSRLEILDYMLRKTKQDYDKVSGQSMLPYSKEMGRILEQARKEVEGEQIRLNIDGTINITSTIESSKSVEQLYSDINFMAYIIGRVASRMRVNPLLLQYQLANSWYAKFTGMKRNTSLMDETPSYPSKIILNWADLQDKVEEKEKEYEELKDKFTQEVEYTPIQEEVNQADKLRAALKEKLKAKQEEVEAIKNRVTGLNIK